MKIILSSVSPSIDSNIDPRFGRGAHFIVVDPDSMEWQAHANPGVGAPGGAGTLAAQFVAQQGADAVISGDFGPNAFNALHAANIAMYLYGSSTTIKEAVDQFKNKKLESVGAPTGEARHSHG